MTVKAAIRGNLVDRHLDPVLQDFLHKCTALDPRFKALPHVGNTCHERIFNSLIELVAFEEQVFYLFYIVFILHYGYLLVHRMLPLLNLKYFI